MKECSFVAIVVIAIICAIGAYSTGGIDAARPYMAAMLTMSFMLALKLFDK